MEWVEVRGKTIDVAVEAAMHELGISQRERIDVEVIQEPERGLLGIGGKDAIVRVKPKPEQKKRRRRRKRGKGGDQEGAAARGDQRQGRQGGRQGKQGDREGGRPGGKQASSRRDGRGGGGKAQGGKAQGEKTAKQERKTEEAKTVAIEDQAPVVKEFLVGLVDAFGLDGEVSVRVEDDTIVAEVQGAQTEAMVGPRGSVIEAIHELTKTVLQRKTQASARVRLDIAGYAERRRQALSIYAEQLIDQVLEEGGEVMLEPMSAGDRKVIHDAVAAREGVRSYSEGESPQRYVVIARVSEEGEEE